MTKDLKKTKEALQTVMDYFKEMENGQGNQPTISFEEGIENTGGKCPKKYVLSEDKEIVNAVMTLRRLSKKGNRSFVVLANDDKQGSSMLDFGGKHEYVYDSLIGALSCDHIFRRLVEKALNNAD